MKEAKRRREEYKQTDRKTDKDRAGFLSILKNDSRSSGDQKRMSKDLMSKRQKKFFFNRINRR